MLKLTDKNECECFDDPFCLVGLQTGDDAKISCYAIYLVGDTWRALLLFLFFISISTALFMPSNILHGDDC